MSQIKKEMKLGATDEKGNGRKLMKAKSSKFPSPLPFHYRFLGSMLAMFCAFSFYLGPLLWTLPPVLYVYYPKVAMQILLLDIICVLHPVKPWPAFRNIFQLWYEIFDFHHNVTDEFTKEKGIENNLQILGMHPHGVIPMHGFIWTAFCEQYLNGCYGFGAVTDAVMWLPIIRQILGWLSAGSASKSLLMRGMQKDGKNLYIFPGGVAEIFLSKRRRKDKKNIHHIKARRYGLMKLALQTGASIIPVYVFGATDFFDQVATIGESDTATSSYIGSFLQRLSRRMKGGMTLFWGQYGTPLPHCPKVSMVLGDPIVPVEGTEGTEKNICGPKLTCQRIKDPTPEQVEELLDRYIDALQRLFDQYKIEAGYENDELRIQ